MIIKPRACAMQRHARLTPIAGRPKWRVAYLTLRRLRASATGAPATLRDQRWAGWHGYMNPTDAGAAFMVVGRACGPACRTAAIVARGTSSWPDRARHQTRTQGRLDALPADTCRRLEPPGESRASDLGLAHTGREPIPCAHV